MRKVFNYFLLLLIAAYGCKSLDQSDNDVHILINDFLAYHYFNANLLITDTYSNKDTFTSKFLKEDSLWNLLVSGKYLTTEDVQYMKDELNNNISFTWDSSKIEVKTVKASTFGLLYNNVAANFLKPSYNDSLHLFSYVKTSKPLYSANHNKVLLVINMHYNVTCGKGAIVLFERRTKGWKVVDCIKTWEN